MFPPLPKSKRKIQQVQKLLQLSRISQYLSSNRNLSAVPLFLFLSSRQTEEQIEELSLARFSLVDPGDFERDDSVSLGCPSARQIGEWPIVNRDGAAAGFIVGHAAGLRESSRETIVKVSRAKRVATVRHCRIVTAFCDGEKRHGRRSKANWFLLTVSR